MAKRLALTDYIALDGVDISNLVRALEFESTDEEVDVSGFNPTGASEFLQGTRVRAVTIECYVSRGANEIHQIVFPIHDARASCTFVWRADGAAGAVVSATNEELRGLVKIPAYTEGGTRGEAETTSVRLVEASATTPLTFYST